MNNWKCFRKACWVVFLISPLLLLFSLELSAIADDKYDYDTFDENANTPAVEKQKPAIKIVEKNGKWKIISDKSKNKSKPKTKKADNKPETYFVVRLSNDDFKGLVHCRRIDYTDGNFVVLHSIIKTISGYTIMNEILDQKRGHCQSIIVHAKDVSYMTMYLK